LWPGEYVTEKGWGRLQLIEHEGTLTFAIESVTGEDYCTLHGAIQADIGTADDDSDSAACAVKFTDTTQGIEVAATTPTVCRRSCGYNGNFEGHYLKVVDGCSRSNLDRAREAFKHQYDSKDYTAALTTLSPALKDCLPTLEWEEEGQIRNDLAITQYKNGLYAECLATLDTYINDADKDDDAVTEGWTPALADRYLAIIHAARTNISLCRKGPTKKLAGD
jgi:hypothetical protein